MWMEEELLEVKKVLITPQGMSLLQERFQELFGLDYEIVFTNGIVSDRRRLKDLLKDKDACIIGSEKIDNTLLESCRHLKIISRFGTGYDSICADSLKKHGVALAVTAKHSTDAVARHSLSLLLSLTNNLLTQNYSSYLGIWDRTLNLSADKTVIGLIGMGAIGQKFASYLLMLGFKVKYFSRSRNSEVEKNGVEYVSTIKKLVRLSDIISIHLKLTKETKNIINRDIVELLTGKYFINTSRGGLVDEEALFEHLSNGNIKGAGLDVYKVEPAIGRSQTLQSLANVTATCHVSAYDNSSIMSVGEEAIGNIKKFFQNSAQ
jgi:D-3-phosphoglycerate dehydrogenase / 2-oxoglutarate reductase